MSHKLGQNEFTRLLEACCLEATRREAIAERLAAQEKPVLMICDDGRQALAQADMAEPGQYRTTWFFGKEPTGHCNFNSLKEAIIEGLKAGYHPNETA